MYYATTTSNVSYEQPIDLINEKFAISRKALRKLVHKDLAETTTVEKSNKTLQRR